MPDPDGHMYLPVHAVNLPRPACLADDKYQVSWDVEW